MARLTPRVGNGSDFLHPLVATYLLTGGRKSEVLGLEVGDVSFDRQAVTFRPNGWRGLKTGKSHRTIRLMPQPAEILRPYVVPADSPPWSGLLFPALAPDGSQRMVGSFDKALDVVAVRAGWKQGEVRAQAFPNSYIAARLQCLDGGAPISKFTVSREVGHSSTDMIGDIYGHLGVTRVRGEHVEFVAAQHVDAIRKQFGDSVTKILLQQPKTEEQPVA